MEPINTVDNANPANIREAASLSMLKNALDTQKSDAQQLIKTLPTVQDTTVGQNVDLYA